MRADKLRAWLERARVGAYRILLQHDSVGDAKTFASFQAVPLPDIQQIFDACGDLADELEQSVRVAVVVVNEDGESLAQCFHKQMPIEASSEHALNAADVSMGGIVSQLLKHIEVQQRAVTGSHVSIYDAFERTLARLEKITERQSAQITHLTEALREVSENSSEETEEQREEAISRRAAWERVTELAPIVTEFALKAVSSKMNGHSGQTNTVNGVVT